MSFSFLACLQNLSGALAKSPQSNVRKQWNNEGMEAAMKVVADGEMTVIAASHTFQVPRKDRVKGRVVHGMNPGLRMVISSEEEKSR